MTTKELLARDKELLAAAGAVVKSEWFQKYLLFVMVEFTSLECSAEMLAGAGRFQRILLSLTDAEEGYKPLPGPGLVHDIDDPRNEINQPKT